MTLADLQSTLDTLADTVIQTGASPSEANVEVWSQDGILNKIEVTWISGDTHFTAITRRR